MAQKREAFNGSWFDACRKTSPSSHEASEGTLSKSFLCERSSATTNPRHRSKHKGKVHYQGVLVNTTRALRSFFGGRNRTARKAS